MIKRRVKTEARKTIRLRTICYLVRCFSVPAIEKMEMMNYTTVAFDLGICNITLVPEAVSQSQTKKHKAENRARGLQQQDRVEENNAR